MSLPYYSLNCTFCNLERHFLFDTAYEFEDTDEKGYTPALHTAWCTDCDKVVISANPQTQVSIASELKSRTACIEEERHRKRSLRHPFRKPDERIIQRLESEIAHLKMSVEFFRYQGMMPRCLTCGGENITGLELPDAGSASIGIRHHCGGTIYAATEGRVNFGKLPVVTYNIKGQILSDEREENAANALDQEELRTVIGLAAHVSVRLLDTAQLPDHIENLVHLEFSVLGVYLSVREYLAVADHGENAVAISLYILTNPPYLNDGLGGNKQALNNIRHFILESLRKYDREANRCFGNGPASWGNSKESQEFGRATFQLLFERLSSYPEFSSTPMSLSKEGMANEIAMQPERLSIALYELLKEETT